MALPAALRAQDKVPGSVVAYSPASDQKYIGSPSLAVLPNGHFVASHDQFGKGSTEHESAVSRIYTSTNKGKSWSQIAEIKGAFWSKLFVHKGVLYFMGTNKHHGNTLIRKSLDGGRTWTEPTDKTNGLLLAGEYHCAPMPVIEVKGRLWRTMESAYGPIREWGKRYGAMMLSVPLDADLMNADNWTASKPLLFDSTYLSGHFTGWLEGNAVVDPKGGIVDMLRVDDKTTLEEKAAIVHISDDGKTGTFDPATGFIKFPGGSKKFTIRFDPESKRYWTLSNLIPEDVKAANVGKNPASLRNTLVLMSSADLVNWQPHEVILSHPDPVKHAFQYVDWMFEGKNIIFLSRTAFDDEFGGADRGHDANFLTFHRIKNFRKKVKETYE
ncbi:MAG: exo-alpha-sialidase [Pedobacter sp.]|nr:MAG: exo-alpha-sialidase [Pedobacter sp.]